MKGMSIEQYVEVVKFVQKHHKFAKWISDEERKQEIELYPNLSEHGFNIKYIDSCYDSRGFDIWSVKFRGFGGIRFHTNFLTALSPKKDFDKIPFDNLFDWVMAYLKGEWEDKSILEKLTLKDE
jgi:hypothetical protein